MVSLLFLRQWSESCKLTRWTKEGYIWSRHGKHRSRWDEMGQRSQPRSTRWAEVVKAISLTEIHRRSVQVSDFIHLWHLASLRPSALRHSLRSLAGSPRDSIILQIFCISRLCTRFRFGPAGTRSVAGPTWSINHSYSNSPCCRCFNSMETIRGIFHRPTPQEQVTHSGTSI